MKQAHTLREYQYYDKDTLCSIIDADFTTKQVRYLLKERVLTVLLAQKKKLFLSNHRCRVNRTPSSYSNS